MIIPSTIINLVITLTTLTNLILAQDFTSNATGIQGTWSSGSGSVLTGPVSYLLWLSVKVWVHWEKGESGMIKKLVFCVTCLNLGLSLNDSTKSSS